MISSSPERPTPDEKHCKMLRRAVALVCALLLAASPVAAICPAECQCRLIGLHRSVDCSSLEYTTLPAGLPADTSHLRLGYNIITTLQNTSFVGVPKVARLWLNDNSMETVESGAFRDLTSLSWLSLENNKIMSLHPDIFNNLPHLFKLVLSGNPLSLPDSSPFLRTEALQILDMENCGLETIHSWTYADMENIMTLRLGSNSLRAVTLNISSLSHLDLHKNSIGPTTFRLRITAPRLLKLDLSSCLLTKISAEFLHSFPQLEFLDVSDNIIDSLSSDIFSPLHDLQKINLTNNLINTVPLNVAQHNRKLETIDLSNNPILLTENNLLTHCSARIIMLKRCRLREVPIGALDGFPNATELHLSNNKLQSLSKTIFTNLTRLNSIYMNGNRLTHIQDDTFEDLVDLTFLDLSRNSLNELSDDGAFLRSASLRALRLDECGLESLPAASLRALPALSSLSLAGNSLAFVSDAALRAAPLLRKLLVAGNPWRCDCALRPLWLWCAGEDQPETSGAGPARTAGDAAARCVDAEETGCDRPSNRRFVTLAVLTCRENSGEELDLTGDAEWLGAAGVGGGTRAPPDRLSA